MKTIATIGLDIAKQVFQVHGADKAGGAVLRRKLRRSEVTRFFSDAASVPGRHRGQRQCALLGAGSERLRTHGSADGATVRQAIREVAKERCQRCRSDLRSRDAAQHAIRSPEVCRTARPSVPASSTQPAGGLPHATHQPDPRSVGRVRDRFAATSRSGAQRLTVRAGGCREPTDRLRQRSYFRASTRSWRSWTRRSPHADHRIQLAFQNNPDCQRIAAVEGVGPLIATAVVAAISNGHAFENGRQFSAWLGLVPRQNSSGGKSRLLGISKRGDPYLRTLLIHGARSVVYRAKAKTDKRSLWINDKQQRLGTSKACVAVANKNARIIWSLIAREQEYRRAA